jgi:hypothetical protein
MAASMRILAALMLTLFTLGSPLGMKSQFQRSGSHVEKSRQPGCEKGTERKLIQTWTRAITDDIMDIHGGGSLRSLKNEGSMHSRCSGKGNEGAMIMLRLRGGIDSLLSGDKEDRMKKINEYFQEKIRNEEAEKAAEEAEDRETIEHARSAWDNFSDTLQFYTTDGEPAVWFTPEEKAKFANRTCIDQWQDEQFRSSWANYHDR